MALQCYFRFLSFTYSTPVGFVVYLTAHIYCCLVYIILLLVSCVPRYFFCLQFKSFDKNYTIMFPFFMNAGRCREFQRRFNDRSWRRTIKAAPKLCVRFQVGGSKGKPLSKSDPASIKWAWRLTILVKSKCLYCVHTDCFHVNLVYNLGLICICFLHLYMLA